MPALGKGGPRPGCLRGAFSSGRTGWLGTESGCGGGTRGGRESSAPGAGGSTSLHRRRRASPPGLHRRGGGRVQPAPRPHLLLRLSRRETSPGAFFLVRQIGVGSSGPGGRGRGCPVLAAVASWPPPRSGWCVEARTGLPLPLPWGPPYELRPLPARHPGARARGLCHPVPGSNLAEAAASLEGRGRGWQPREELLPSAGSAVPLLAAGFARRREPQRPPLPGRTRAEERSARTQAPAAPWPGRRPGRRGWRRSRWLQGARAAPRPGSHPFPLVLARNVGL